MQSDQFEKNVVPDEHREISQRRTRLGRKDADIDAAEPLNSNLVGLALSGGGIRSSTLSLGLIQALAESKVLPKVDYLSTVSGGGFVGACLSSTLNTDDVRSSGEAFPLRENTGTAESPEMTQLRNSGKYLAPSGFLEKLRIPALLIRGL